MQYKLSVTMKTVCILFAC